MTVAGRYVLLQPLPDGLHLARDEQTGMQVFVREVQPPPELDGSERRALAERVVRSADGARRLRHPSINHVLDAVLWDDRAWIVTSPISGQPLGALVAHSGPIAPDRVAAIGLELLGALRSAHAVGVLHADVQPSRVWLTVDGHAVLTGFGAGVLAHSAAAASIGTPGFTAPELLDAAHPGPAADLWSLAATLYFAAEGMPPFAGDGPLAVLSAVLSGQPRPPERSGPLGPVLLGQLAKEPADRPVTLRDALEPITGTGNRSRRIQTRPLALAASAVGLALAVASVSVIATVTLKPPKDDPTPTPVATAAPAATDPGKFAAAPRACSQLTDAQAQEVVSNFRKSPANRNDADPQAGCDIFDAEAVDHALRIDLVLNKPGPLGGGPETAREYVNGSRNDADQLTVTGDETKSPVRELTGVGDQAIAFDRYYIGSYETRVVFSVSNLAVVVGCKRRGPTGAPQSLVDNLKTCAEKAARWTAESLNRQG